jgi:hypothetical protein
MLIDWELSKRIDPELEGSLTARGEEKNGELSYDPLLLLKTNLCRSSSSSLQSYLCKLLKYTISVMILSRSFTC